MKASKKNLILAIACAALASLCVFGYTATVSSEAKVARDLAINKYGGERTEVVVATKDIGAGEVLNSSNCELKTWLVDLLPKGTTISSLDDIDDQVAAVDIQNNEVLLFERIGDGSSRINVPSGLEAVSISSDDVLAVGGAIRAGSFVDVYVETDKNNIVLLGKNILVLETNKSTKNSKDTEEITWVTLAVESDSVSALMKASSNGTIHLALPAVQSDKSKNNNQ
ncbi:MAG: Flp pilus assembly protein CpaB [Coriobacteriales bacterium]|nr:Flp pilus assembly protein CpaB [Coriobacteriales bacterium]